MRKRTIERGTLYFLWNPGQGTFSGYGLTVEEGRKDYLAGLLMIDRPSPVDPNWLSHVEITFGGYALYPMTAGGERGLACQMWIDKRSLPHVRHMETPIAAAMRSALLPLLDTLPNPQFLLHWDAQACLWRSTFYPIIEKGRVMMASQPHREPLFPLGQVVATPGALEALEEAGQTPLEFLCRHANGDWGIVPEEDKKENELSLQKGFRILSAYRLSTGVKIWCITEADRSATALLLPQEY